MRGVSVRAVLTGLVAAALTLGLATIPGTASATLPATPHATQGIHRVSDDYNCSDFATQAQAQHLYNKYAPGDPDGLDSDDDGIACETLPCPCSFGTGTGGGGPAVKHRIVQKARVVKVTDGDTIKVRITGKHRAKSVRLIGIDTPEAYGGVECGGPQASRSMRQLLHPGSRVKLTSDPTQDKVDRYGRLLRYVKRVRGQVDVNRRQLTRGWARVYVYEHNPFERVASYRHAKRKAKAAGRGIWSRCR